MLGNGENLSVGDPSPEDGTVGEIEPNFSLLDLPPLIEKVEELGGNVDEIMKVKAPGMLERIREIQEDDEYRRQKYGTTLPVELFNELTRLEKVEKRILRDWIGNKKNL
jgi:hypothetical protein